MEEEIAKALNRRAELNPRPVAPNSTTSSSPMSISPMKLIGWRGGASRGSVDEGLPSPTSSPTSSPIFSQSLPGASVWTSSGSPGSPSSMGMLGGGGRRESLKHLWHLQDFGTD